MNRLDEWAERFLLSAKGRNLRPSTLYSYRQHTAQFIRFAADRGLHHVEEITPGVLREWMRDMVDRNLAGISINTKRLIVVMMMQEAADEYETVDHNWKRKARPVKTDQEEVRCLTTQEVTALLEAQRQDYYKEVVYGARDAAMLRFALDTGMRIGELVSLKLVDIDFNTRTVTVRHTKGRRTRRVWYSESTGAAIDRYMMLRNRHPKASKPDTFLVSDWGATWSKCGYYRRFIRIANGAGLDGVHPHTTRHTCATMLLRNGMPVVEVQKFLGHAHIVHTLRYAHLVDDDVRRNYEKYAPMSGIDRPAEDNRIVVVDGGKEEAA